jgi:hypothetical protein
MFCMRLIGTYQMRTVLSHDKGPVSSTSVGHLHHVYEVLYGRSRQMTWMIPGLAHDPVASREPARLYVHVRTASV